MTRVYFNTKEHFSVLANQFCISESELLNQSIRQYIERISDRKDKSKDNNKRT